MVIGGTINGNGVGRGRTFVNFDVDANPKISISILAAFVYNIRLGSLLVGPGRFQGKIVNFFFAGAPHPGPQPAEGEGANLLIPLIS